MPRIGSTCRFLIAFRLSTFKTWWRPGVSNPSRQDACKATPQPSAAPIKTSLLRTLGSNQSNLWLTVRSMHLAWILRSKEFSLRVWRLVGVSIPLPQQWQCCALPIELTKHEFVQGIHGVMSYITSVLVAGFPLTILFLTLLDRLTLASSHWPYRVYVPCGVSVPSTVSVKPTQSRMGRFLSTLVLVIVLVFLVETTGVEPVVPFGRRIYSPLGLPIFLHLHLKSITSL